MIGKQTTMRLPMTPRGSHIEETTQQRYRRLKAISDATGIRLIFVYLADQRQRLSAINGEHEYTKTLL